MIALHVCNMLRCGLLSSRLTIHIPLVKCGSRFPMRMMSLFLSRMTRRRHENFAVHPWSHNKPIERRPVVRISGKMCWVHAAGGSEGIWRSLVWVDVIVPPLGNNTLMPFTVVNKLILLLVPA